MAPDSAKCWLIAAAASLLTSAVGFAADIPDNLITNGGFEAGMQIWKGDGKIVLLPDGNRVCEIEASKSRRKDIKQEFHMRQLQQVEVVFRARSIDYVGPGLHISVHQVGSGSIFWDRPLPTDGSWGHYRVVYTRASANSDLRELNIATQLGTGKIQIDDVEVREPSKVAVDNQPPEPVAPPAATPAPLPKAFPPVAIVKPPAPPIPVPAATPAAHLPPLNVPPGTFGSLEQIIQSAPADVRRKLQDPETVDAAVAEINEYLAQNVKGKPARLHLNIDDTRPSESGNNKYLVHVSDRPATIWNAVPLTAWLWVRFTEEAPTVGDKLNAGSAPTVSGVITRCQIGKGGRFHLDVDLGQSKLEGP